MFGTLVTLLGVAQWFCLAHRSPFLPKPRVCLGPCPIGGVCRFRGWRWLRDRGVLLSTVVVDAPVFPFPIMETKKLQSSRQESFGESLTSIERRRRGPPGALGCGGDELDTQPANEWQIASEERRKLRAWGHYEILGCMSRLVPPGVRKPGSLGSEHSCRIGTTGKIEGSFMAGSPHEAATVATASLARWRRWLSVVLQRGNAAMMLAALGKPQPASMDADLLQFESDIRVEAGPS